MILTTFRDGRTWSGWFDRDDRWYDRVAADRGGDLILGRFEERASACQRPGGSWSADGEGQIATDLAFLVTTSDLGVLEYRRGRFTTILPGHTFGVCALLTDTVGSVFLTGGGREAGSGSQALVGFQATGLHGRLALLHQEPAEAPPAVESGSAGLAAASGGAWKASTLLWGLTRGVHQVRARDDELLVTDTYRNRLLLFSVQDLLSRRPSRGQGWRGAVRHIAYPEGPLTQGQRSANYRHFNSLLPHPDGSWLVMAHNDTLKTGRPSTIYTLDRDLQVVDVTDTGGAECHDLLLDAGGRLMFCRSAEGTLAVDGLDVLRIPQFTRGLAVGPDLVLLGGSPRGDRSQRRTGTAVIHVLDGAFGYRGLLRLPATQVHDLHLLPSVRPSRADSPCMPGSHLTHRRPLRPGATQT